ncbi:bifunctional protein tyrosine phosphatase family protein/NAD(P)/FAD-dependent oxidoreductase [Sphingopyxis sp.]|uniref:bifunctional protein tyrosine phosphatase family protein/NAD(P)/FAD-dependent oxidoreductase n=1 Tax=Sphingopyxis sp. TaxID=1908224 RepID=UPI001D38EEEB|nr:bifunctional protein tyrosine phosphatase family protein/NAD(P)/FAD-dependent oxidoreductase [Sphingopyxis sp.]MBW8294456.1 TIGR01244 family phosphatase [Sphingopyxis sp.]
MDIKTLSADFSVSPQILPAELAIAAAQGFKSIICNRPDGEADDQPDAAVVRAAAQKEGLAFAYVPVMSTGVTPADAVLMADKLAELPKPILAYCRSGARSGKIWEMAKTTAPVAVPSIIYDVVIVGGGSAGIATAASLLNRNRKLKIAVIEPSEEHYYQPGWTLVGAGIFSAEFTKRTEKSVMPKGVDWIKKAASGFAPEDNQVLLADGSALSYRVLVACPGVKLDWDAISGLSEALGKNGVTSNYRYDLAPYTNRLVKDLKRGRALFTQPPMPIKCAGAPQKSMYLSCSAWERAGVLGDIDVQFHNTGAVLFGVAAYVPALMEYVERYKAHLNFESKLVAIDGTAKIATFEQKNGDTVTRVEEKFDMIHVVPPQVAPDFVRNSPLAAASGFIEVNEATLQHVRYPNVFALGDACSASNAKTMAAARKQAPVVAVNVLAALEGKPPVADYDGYGSCPLTVERGKIILAEFGYGGKLLPSFPNWLIDGTRPSRLSWLLKDTILPPIYWHGMLKGREWMVNPHMIATA